MNMKIGDRVVIRKDIAASKSLPVQLIGKVVGISSDYVIIVWDDGGTAYLDASWLEVADLQEISQ